MNKRNAEQRLQDALDTLPREILPQRDLWPGIAHALQIPERAPLPWQRQAALAASVLLVLTLSLYFGQSTQPLPNSVAEEFFSTLQREHELNKQMLLVGYRNQQPLFANWEQQLLQLEQAEAAIFEALRDDPQNRELIEILRQVQDKQLNVIDKAFDPRTGSI